MNIILAGLIALLISFSPITIYAQQVHTLKGTAGDMFGRKVELLDFLGDKNRVVSSTTVDKKGLFQFLFNDDSPVGMYRLRFERGRSVDVIYNRKDIELSITRPNVQAGLHSPLDDIAVLSSGDNRLYYDFLQALNRKEMRTVLINQLKVLYSPLGKDSSDRNPLDKPEAVTGTFYNRLENELQKIEQEFEAYLQLLFNNNLHSYTAKMIKALKTPVLKIGGGGRESQSVVEGPFLGQCGFGRHHTAPQSGNTLKNIRVYFPIP